MHNQGVILQNVEKAPATKTTKEFYIPDTPLVKQSAETANL